VLPLPLLLLLCGCCSTATAAATLSLQLLQSATLPIALSGYCTVSAGDSTSHMRTLLLALSAQQIAIKTVGQPLAQPFILPAETASSI
jgi:hypothetical protein